MTDLRTLAQAYLAAREVDATSGDLTASREVTRIGLALGAALGTPNSVPPAANAAAILAALDAAEAQGYARAMGEVDSLLQQRVQAHRDAMLDRMPQYAHDIRQGAREEATEIREWLSRRLLAEARIERVGAILSDEGCDCDSDGHNADCDLCLACRIDREVSP